MSPERRKSVYIAYTGGTIGMRPGPRGYEPARGFLAEQMDRLAFLDGPDVPAYTIHEYEPLLDSSNMTPGDWMKLARDLGEHYDAYDGFIVLHGTDTMAYSASALSFLLENLGKPVLFTGSQIPLFETRTDARDNLVSSLLIAAHEPIPEVCLYAGHSLLRGNRATKVSANRFLAFESPNFPRLGQAGVEVEIDFGLVRPRPGEPLRVHALPERGAHLNSIRLFPGITPEILRQALQPPVQGVVLHTFGVGNAPDDPALLEVLAEATGRGVVIVNCTQCLEGSVRMDTYVTGHALHDAGVVSGHDMTPEAALTKLYFLLARGLPADEVRRLVETDLRGELTRPQEAP